jgi:hypothetical protein
LDWVAASSEGVVLAGHGRNGAQTLVRRSGGVFEPVDGFPRGDVRRAAITASHLWVITNTGLHAFPLNALTDEDEALFLTGTFHDVCAFPSGRVAVVGPWRGPLQPVWAFEDGAWRNLNVGTRELLRGIHCGGDGRIYVAGEHGMVARESASP